MFAHVATFTIETDHWRRALGTLVPAKSEIAAIPGLRSWITVANPESGEGFAISVFETESELSVGVPEIGRILSGLAETFQAPWHTIRGEVLAFADNDWQDRIHHK